MESNNGQKTTSERLQQSGSGGGIMSSTRQLGWRKRDFIQNAKAQQGRRETRTTERRTKKMMTEKRRQRKSGHRE